MRTLRTVLAASLTVGAYVLVTARAATAQVSLDPTATPKINESATGPLGPLPSIAALMFGLGVVVLILMIVAYMRFAPRFTRDEERFNVVRADRVRVGQELPRRAVDVSQAVPVVVAPPAVPVAAAAAPAPAPAAAPASAAAPAAAAEGSARAAEGSARAAEGSAPPAEGSAPPAEGSAPPAEGSAPAAAEERPEVSLDEEVFQRTLDELLAKGTSRRVAEGQARRAAMIAARKKATGG
jgi:hypothetical protein